MRNNDSDRRAREFGLLLAAARGHTLGLVITHPEGDTIIDGAMDRLTRARLLLIEERTYQRERDARRAARDDAKKGR